MYKTMKFVTSLTSNSSSTIDISVDYVYVESPENMKNDCAINAFKHYSPCDNCPNNPALNKFASGVCNCTLNLPIIT